MPSRRLTFQIDIDANSAQNAANRVLQTFQSRLQNVQMGVAARGGTTGGAAGGGGALGGVVSGMSSFLTGMVGGIAGGAAYSFVSQIPQQIVEMDALATRANRIEASFVSLAGSQEKVNSLTNAYTEATGGAVANIDAMAQSMKLYALGMANSERGMRAFLSAARGISSSTGLDLENTINQLILTMSNQSVLRFDQLGLSIDDHREKMDALKETYPDLSREQRFQMAVMEQAIEKYGQINVLAATQATAMETLTRQWKNFRVEMAGAIQDATAGGLGSIMTMLGNQEASYMRETMEARREEAERQQREQNAWFKSDSFQGQAAEFLRGGFMPTHVKARDDIAQENRTRQLQLEVDVYGKAEAALNQYLALQSQGIEMTLATDNAFRTFIFDIARGGEVTDVTRARLNAFVMLMTQAGDSASLGADDMFDLENATDEASAAIQNLTSSLVTLGGQSFGRLLDVGYNMDQVMGLIDDANLGPRSKFFADWISQTDDPVEQYKRQLIASQALTSSAEGLYDAAKEQESAAKSAARESEAAGKKFASEIESATNNVVKRWESLISKIPGVFGTSEVTQDQMDRAKMGLGNEFADNYLRRLEDEILNKVDRPEVDLGKLAGAAGIDQSLKPEAQVMLLREMWDTGELFSRAETLQFLDKDAIQAEIEKQKRVEIGQENLRTMFGMGTDDNQELLRVFGVSIIDPMQNGMREEIAKQGPIMGQELAGTMYAGFAQDVPTYPWINVVRNALIAQVTGQAADQINGALSEGQP